MLLILFVWLPVWITPPYTQYTPYLYLILLILWPILLFSALRRVMRLTLLSASAVLVVIAVIVITFLTLAGMGLTIMLESVMLPPRCETEDMAEGQVRYTCETRYSGVLVFESRRGLPIIWLVDRVPPG